MESRILGAHQGKLELDPLVAIIPFGLGYPGA
jgi:hypothetical protein